jgi:anti-sigma factor RsiW
MSNLETLDCEAALRLLAAYIDGELPELDEEGVHRHLQRCHSCYSRAEFERQLKYRLAGLGLIHVGSSLEDRIRTLMSDYPDQREQ